MPAVAPLSALAATTDRRGLWLKKYDVLICIPSHRVEQHDELIVLEAGAVLVDLLVERRELLVCHLRLVQVAHQEHDLHTAAAAAAAESRARAPRRDEVGARDRVAGARERETRPPWRDETSGRASARERALGSSVASLQRRCEIERERSCRTRHRRHHHHHRLAPD